MNNVKKSEITKIYSWMVNGNPNDTAWAATVEEAAKMKGVDESALKNKQYHSTVEKYDFVVTTIGSIHRYRGSLEDVIAFAKKEFGEKLIEIRNNLGKVVWS